MPAARGMVWEWGGSSECCSGPDCWLHEFRVPSETNSSSETETKVILEQRYVCNS